MLYHLFFCFQHRKDHCAPQGDGTSKSIKMKLPSSDMFHFVSWQGTQTRCTRETLPSARDELSRRPTVKFVTEGERANTQKHIVQHKNALIVRHAGAVSHRWDTLTPAVHLRPFSRKPVGSRLVRDVYPTRHRQTAKVWVCVPFA